MRKIAMLFALGAPLAMIAACAPSSDQIENSIVEGYTNEGAEDVEVSLESDGEGGYTGYVDYTDPNTGESYRHDCVVDPADGGEAEWRCAP